MNPYAPPASVSEPLEVFEPGLIYRQGDILVIGAGAELPRRCFITGNDTETSVWIKQFWQPAWTYLLILPGVFPYLIVSPIVGKYARLKVPIDPRILRQHSSMFRNALKLLVFSIATIVFAIAMSWYVLVAIGLAFGLGAFIAASRAPITLDIRAMSNQWLYLSGVHPRVLELARDASEVNLA